MQNIDQKIGDGMLLLFILAAPLLIIYYILYKIGVFDLLKIKFTYKLNNEVFERESCLLDEHDAYIYRHGLRELHEVGRVRYYDEYEEKEPKQ